MKNSYVHHEVDIYEVINEFPILKDKLGELEFDHSKIVEGETLKDFFSRQSLKEEEIDFLVTRLNREVTMFFKKPQTTENQGAEIIKREIIIEQTEIIEEVSSDEIKKKKSEEEEE